MATANQVADFLIFLRNNDLENGEKYSLTNLKLQKLLYFSHAFFSVANDQNEGLIDENFQAWRYGPVIPEVYYRFNSFGQSDITLDSDLEFNELTQVQRDVISNVWVSLRDTDAFDLVEISHAPNSPWARVFAEGRNNVINQEDIILYFGGDIQ